MEKQEEASSLHDNLDLPLPKQEHSQLTDYWLGEKYFDYFLAQEFLDQRSQEESIRAVQESHIAALENYPYDQCWAFLSGAGLTSPGSTHTEAGTYYRRNMFSLVGNIIRRGPSEKRKALLSSLDRFTKLHNVGLARHIRNSGVVERSAGLPAVEAQNDSEGRLPSPLSTPAEEEDDVIDISQFTTALKEYGDRLGTVPTYDCAKISSQPSLFRGNLSIQGVKVTGEGRTKRLAKHRASKLACVRLGLLPS